MMRAAVLVAALCAVACATRVEPIPTDKCAASVVASDDDRMYVFSLSEDSVVWFKFQKAEGGWSTWRPLADRKKMASGPKAVRFAQGTLMVFARGTDRLYYSTTMTAENEFSDWKPLAEDVTFSTPPVPLVDSHDSVLVFGINAETHTPFYTQSKPISAPETEGESFFSKFADLGQEATSSPAVLVDSEGLVHVFVRGTNRALWHRGEVYENPGGKKFADWECIGGVMASSPSTPVSLNGVSLVEVYGRAADKALWHRSQEGQLYPNSLPGGEVSWGKWNSLGGVLASAPTVAVNDDGLADVFARATDKAIYYKAQVEKEDGATTYTQWYTLGGMFSTTPTVVVHADGLFDIFARGVDKAIWHSHQVETNGTRTFSKWYSLGGHTRKYAC